MKPEEQLQAQIQTASAPTDTVRDQDKIMLVLAYLGVLALIPLLTVKDSEFVRWHAKNGLTLGIAGLLIIVLFNVFLPVLGCFLWPLETIAFIALTVLAITKALRGMRWRIPVVTDVSEKF
jgi:fumarate reductase subunit D